MDNNIKEARQLVRQLIKISPDVAVAARAEKMLNRMRLPMHSVVKYIPGDTIVAKAARVGVTRQAIYDWLNGISRPNKAMSRKLAKLTGYDADDIRGRPVA